MGVFTAETETDSAEDWILGLSLSASEEISLVLTESEDLDSALCLSLESSSSSHLSLLFQSITSVAL